MSCRVDGKAHDIGAVDTEDVVQFYIRDSVSPDEVSRCRLCGFKRIFLKAGESAEVSFEIGEKAFTVVDNDGRRVPGSGTYRLWAGFCSPGSLGEELTGCKAASTEFKKQC